MTTRGMAKLAVRENAQFKVMILPQRIGDGRYDMCQQYIIKVHGRIVQHSCLAVQTTRSAKDHLPRARLTTSDTALISALYSSVSTDGAKACSVLGAR